MLFRDDDVSCVPAPLNFFLGILKLRWLEALKDRLLFLLMPLRAELARSRPGLISLVLNFGMA